MHNITYISTNASWNWRRQERGSFRDLLGSGFAGRERDSERNSESASKAIFQLEVTFAAYSPGLWLKFQFHSYSWNNSASLE